MRILSIVLSLAVLAACRSSTGADGVTAMVDGREIVLRNETGRTVHYEAMDPHRLVAFSHAPCTSVPDSCGRIAPHGFATVDSTRILGWGADTDTVMVTWWYASDEPLRDVLGLRTFRVGL